MDNILEVKNLTMNFGGIRALDCVNLEIKKKPDRRPHRPQRCRENHFV